MKYIAFLIMAVASVMLTTTAIAQEAVVEIPTWVGGIVSFLMGVPVVGPVVVKVLGYMGLISAVLTAITGILIAVEKFLLQINKIKEMEVIGKIKRYLDVAIAWVGFLSMFNIQKKDAASAGIPVKKE